MSNFSSNEKQSADNNSNDNKIVNDVKTEEQSVIDDDTKNITENVEFSNVINHSDDSNDDDDDDAAADDDDDDDDDDDAAADDDDAADDYTIKTKPYYDGYKGYDGNPNYNGPDNYFTDVVPIYIDNGIDDPSKKKMNSLQSQYRLRGFLYPHEAEWANLFNNSKSAKGKKRFKFGITSYRNAGGMSQDYFTNVPPIYKKGCYDKALFKARRILTEKRNLYRYEEEWLRLYNESRVEAGEQPMWEYILESRGFKTKIDPVYSKTSKAARARARYLVAIDRPLTEEEKEWLELYNTSCWAASAPLVEFKEITPRDESGMPLDYFTKIPPQFTSKCGLAYNRWFLLQKLVRELFPYEKQWLDEYEKSKNSAGDSPPIFTDLKSDGEEEFDEYEYGIDAKNFDEYMSQQPFKQYIHIANEDDSVSDGESDNDNEKFS